MQIEKYLAGFAPKRVFSFHSQQRTKVDCLNVKKGFKIVILIFDNLEKRKTCYEEI